MIEFDVVDDRDLRQVMHELRTFVEVCRVVFVALNDEVMALGTPKTDAKVRHDPADKKRWIQSRLVNHPRRQTRGRRLAVRARNDKRAPSVNELSLQNLRQRAIQEP